MLGPGQTMGFVPGSRASCLLDIYSLIPWPAAASFPAHDGHRAMIKTARQMDHYQRVRRNAIEGDAGGGGAARRRGRARGTDVR
jgi:hypothetical protein